MAKIKITADTKDAQKKIKDLSKNVDSLHKQSEKPLKVRAGAQNRRGSTSDSGKRTITRTESANDGSKNGVAKGAFLGGLGGGIAGVVLQNIPLIVSLVGKAFDGITAAFNFSTNLQGLGETIRKYMELGDAITNPAKGALQRGDNLDALDDERRSHNSASIGDEKAWREAFIKTTGVNADQLLQRGQSYFDNATSSDFEEMEKAWELLAPTGLKFDDLKNNSTWENLVKLIEAYHKAGEDGMNELEPIMQKIFGRKGMDAIRKAGDASSIRADFAELRDTYREVVEPNEAAILKATDEAEMLRAKAGIYDLGMPKGAERWISQGAEDALDIAKTKYNLYGSDRDSIIGAFDTASQPEPTTAPEDLEPVTTAIEEGFNRVAPREQGPSYTPAQEPELEGLFQ
jgi:hypothetical protein